MKKHLDLFSGIGGFALAIDRVWEGVEHIFCDNEPFSQAVLAKHWSKSKIYGDIRTLTADSEIERQLKLAMERKPNKKATVPFSDNSRVDILTGGFPCQPFSQAGRRRGTEDDRYLWPQMLRVISEFHPRWIIGENVGGLVTWSEGMVLEKIHADLESQGYEVQAFVIPAVAVNAPHRRDRVWIVAHAKHEQARDEIRRGNDQGTSARATGSDTNVANSKCSGHTGKVDKTRQSTRHNRGTQSPDWSANWVEVASRLCRMDDGLPKRLDRNPRLKSLGNAIVPQVAEEIMRVIKKVDDHQNSNS